MTSEEAQARVAQGAALLDQHMPGWVSRIDVGTLDLFDGQHCILGQLCGRGLWTLSRAFDEAVWGEEDTYLGAEGIGCLYRTANDEEDERRGYALLQDAWIAAIADRVVQPEPVSEPVGCLSRTA